MMGFTEGLRIKVNSDFAVLGRELVPGAAVARPPSATSTGRSTPSGANLTREQGEALKGLPHALHVSVEAPARRPRAAVDHVALHQARSSASSAGRRRRSTPTRLTVARGRFLTEVDTALGRRVVVPGRGRGRRALPGPGSGRAGGARPAGAVHGHRGGASGRAACSGCSRATPSPSSRSRLTTRSTGRAKDHRYTIEATSPRICPRPSTRWSSRCAACAACAGSTRTTSSTSRTTTDGRHRQPAGPGGGRGDLRHLRARAAGGRHRHHEHHAGLGHASGPARSASAWRSGARRRAHPGAVRDRGGRCSRSSAGCSGCCSATAWRSGRASSIDIPGERPGLGGATLARLRVRVWARCSASTPRRAPAGSIRSRRCAPSRRRCATKREAGPPAAEDERAWTKQKVKKEIRGWVVHHPRGAGLPDVPVRGGLHPVGIDDPDAADR